MSRKISISDKKRWLQLFESGKTEVQIARKESHDPRTIARGIEEAVRDRRLVKIEDDIVHKALLGHQEQLRDILKEIASILVVPTANLELHEVKQDKLAPVQLSGCLVKETPVDQMVLEIHAEQRLEWELLQEHTTHDKIWYYLKQWRSAVLDFVMAEWRFKKSIKTLLENIDLEPKERLTKGKTDYYLPICIELFNEVAVRKIMNIPDGANLEKNLIDGDDGLIRRGPGGTELAYSKDAKACREKMVSVFLSLPQTPEASEIRCTYEGLTDITKTARREVDELLLLNMVAGRCRVCRRLGR